MKVIKASLILLLVILIFPACTSIEDPLLEEPPAFDINAVTFEKETVLLCEAEDAVGAPYVLKKNLEVTQYEGTEYAFEASISMEDRAQCIETTAALLRRISSEQNIRINIYSKQTYGASFVEGNTLYTCVQDWQSIDYTACILYTLWGEYCHFGLIYGYSSFLCEELYQIPAQLLDDGFEFDEDANILDLNLLCFLPEFVSEADIRNSEQLANTFVYEYISVNGELALHELLSNSGKIETVSSFTDALLSFYVSKGITHIPSPLLFRLGGRGYAYIVKNPYCVMYIEQGWYDPVKDLCPYSYDGFLLMNLADTMQFFAINTRQMEQYQQLFGFDDYSNDLRVFFTTKEHFHGVTTSEYDHSTHAVALQATSSFMHEYIHSLTFDRTIKENWAIEGSARHYSFYYDYYANAMNDVDFQNVIDQREFLYLKEFQDHLGRVIETDTDFAQINHLTAYAFGQDDPNNGGGYVPGASFIAYLISRFGEETVIDILFETHDFGEHTYEELVADWQIFIQETYSSYTKSK